MFAYTENNEIIVKDEYGDTICTLKILNSEKKRNEQNRSETMEEKKWRVALFNDFISIRDSNGDEVCYIDDFTDRRKTMENARLIASAPEMRRVLKSMLKDFNAPGASPADILAWRNEIERLFENEE